MFMAVETPSFSAVKFKLRDSRRRRSPYHLVLSLLTACLVGTVTQAQQTLSQGNAYSTPNTVGAQSAQLQLVFALPIDIEGGSTIQVTVPESTRLEQGALTPCSLSGVYEVNQFCQTSSLQTISFVLPEEGFLIKDALNQIFYSGVFFGPLSTKPTEPFEIKITSREGDIVIQDNQAMVLNDLVTAEIQAASTSQINSVIVAESTGVSFKVTTLNPIPSTGGVRLRLPKWNPLAPKGVRESFLVDEIFMNSSSGGTAQGLPIDYDKLCSPKSGVDLNMKCTHWEDLSQTYDYITITDMFSDGKEAGKTFEFYISRLRNSISMSPVAIEIITFESSELTPDGESKFGGLIDKGNAEFKAQESQKIDPNDCKVKADDQTVQEFSVFYISFKVPVPVQSGCIVTIQLPEDFDLIAGSLARIEGWGIFGRRIDLNFGIDETARYIKIVDQCTLYTAANSLTELQITSIKNPNLVKETKSFLIEVQDNNAQGIAIVETGIYFTSIGGFVENISLESLGGEDIEEVVDMKLTFTLPHAISGTSYILMTLPAQIDFSCNLSYTIGIKTAPSCEVVSGNQLRFQNPFSDDNYAGKEEISIVFKNRILPGANLMIKGIKIQTYMSLEGADYLIDTFDEPEFEFFAPIQQLFLSSSVSVEKEETFEETNFFISNKLANNVEEGAIINITIPKEIEVKDAASVMASCIGELNLLPSLTCELVTKADLSHQLTVKNAFGPAGLSKEKEFTVKIERGLITPISKQTSSTFTIILTDKDGHEINFVKNSLSLTMAEGKDIDPIGLEVGSGIVGDKTSHKISFKTSAPLYNDFLIIVNIPEECRPPMNSQFQCLTSYPLSETETECRINGQRVTVAIKLADTYPGERIAIGEEIHLDFSLIRNPSSTVPTEPYEIQIRTDGYHLVALTKNPSTSVINTTPAEIPASQIDFEALDMRQLITTTLTLTWENTQVYPEGLAVLLEYNPEEFEPVNTRPRPGFDDQTIVTCILSRTVDLECIYDKTMPGIIKIVDILRSEQNPGLQLSLTLTNQKILVENPVETTSWKMTTYTDSTTQYSIDTANNGLSFEFSCKNPCLTCLPGQPEMCTSCNVIEEYLILYENKCYDDCPERTYKEAYQCIPCDDKCKTCTDNSGSTCTSCYGGYSNFPFLYGNTCVDKCEYGYYGNRSDADCQKCDSPCETCDEKSTQCTSCIMPLAGETITKFYHDNQCKDQCPDGWIADVPSRLNVCEKCASNCKTCFGVKDQCETCRYGEYLNKLDYTCVQKCPKGPTVQTTEKLNGRDNGVCEPCESSCVTCGRGSPKFCTKCQSNLNLLRTTGICKLECDESNFTQVSLDEECVGCSSGCATCQKTQDNCLSCDPNSSQKYLSANKCVETCPTKNGYQYEGNTDLYPGICVIPGLQCGFGYELIPSGDGCALKLQICIAPNTLNYDKTTCVPGSDQWIPFPMLSFFVLIAFIVAIAKCKARESCFVANLIVFGSIIEFGGMIVVFMFAYDFGIAPVVYMMLFAILFTVAINLFFFIVFQKQVMNDLVFRHWVTYNKCNVHTISAFGLIFSFKIYRLLYSEFCGAKRFNAPFRDDYKFFTPLNLASFLNLLIVKLVCMVACIFGIYYVTWGYQLMMECFEFLIIEVIMLALSIIEYCQMRSTLMAKKAAWKVDSKQVQGHAVKVMAGFDDDDQDPDAYLAQEGKYIEKARIEPKAKALKTINTMQLLLATKLAKRHAIQQGCENTKQEIELLHEKELMLRNRRRCMSFRLERPDFRDAWDMNSDDDDANQNFISEPGSPRSKEMLHNPYFLTRMHALKRVYQMRDQFDNCYAEAKDPSVWPLSNAEQMNKKLQTNVMELLGVDDLEPDTQTQVTVTEEAGDEPEYDQNQAAHLINGVIARIDSEDMYDDKYGTNDGLMQRRGSDPNAENYSSHHDRESMLPPLDQSKMTSTKGGKRKRKRLTRRRMAELPNFDVEEILGEFETDEEGNFIILQTANGKLNDKYGRLVNRRGYLVDLEGNVVTRGNVFIFYKEEIDFDDEVPAPYCFQKSKNVKYTVKNFSAHRRMRKKDKLAMQDEFIEREYLKLKQQARQKGGVYSQQHSQHDAMGINQSEKVHGGESTYNKPISSHMRFMDNSGAQLLQQNSSQHLGDASLSNIVLNDRHANDMFDDADGLNADAFIAQNTTNVKRKPPSSRHSQHKRYSHIGSKQEEVASVDPDDDDLINEVTEPMKAKTKTELLGENKRIGSRQSSRSRSRSKSNERSQRSSKKNRSLRIKGGKMLNEASHRSFDKAENSEHSNTDMMAMPTAGEVGEADLRNLDFDNRKLLLNNSSSMNLNQKKSKRSVLSGQNSRSGLSNRNIYENEMRIHKERKQAVVNDEEFIKKVQQFNSYLDQKKMNYKQSSKKGGGAVPIEPISSALLDDTFLNPDGSVRQVGLAHKNLNSVYGRVRSQFNKQLRQGGAALKFRPQGSSFRNRVDEPRRLIAGMSYGQRERMLQLEINNLIEKNTDEMSLTSIQNKLAGESSTPQNSRQRRQIGSGAQNMRNNGNKINELRGIYSDFRLDGTSNSKPLARGGIAGQMMGNSSPRSHANHLTFDASKILQNDLKEVEYAVAGRHVDKDLKNVSQRVQEAQEQYAAELNKSSNKANIEAIKSVKSNRTAQTGKRTTPNDILHGKYL